MSLGYEFLRELFQEFQELVGYNWIVQGMKGICLTFIVIFFYRKFLNQLKLHKQNSENPPIRPSDIFRALLVFAMCAGYDVVLQMLDSFFIGVEDGYSTFEVHSLIEGAQDESITEDDAAEWTDQLKEAAQVVTSVITDPFYLFVQLLNAIAWLLDLLLYAIYLLERFFVLFILKALGCFAIAAYCIEEARNWTWKWVGLYVAVYMTIIPYMFINQFANVVYEMSLEKLSEETGGISDWGLGFNSIMVPVVLLSVFAKWKVYKKSGEIVNSIFANMSTKDSDDN